MTAYFSCSRLSIKKQEMPISKIKDMIEYCLSLGYDFKVEF